MKVRYLGPSEEVTVFAGEEPILVQRGKAAEVPDELAGAEPKGEEGQKDYDPGSGLLAQVGVFERVGGKS